MKYKKTLNILCTICARSGSKDVNNKGQKAPYQNSEPYNFHLLFEVEGDTGNNPLISESGKNNGKSNQRIFEVRLQESIKLNV